MSTTNYIGNLINIKDKNIIFDKNFYQEEVYKQKKVKIIKAKLTYEPEFCTCCGTKFTCIKEYEKKGFYTSNIKIPSISNYPVLLRLKKQRYKCFHCNSSFSCTTNLVEYGCFISNNTKRSIANDLTKKISEKDIAINNNVSPNTVERIIDSYYNTQKLYKNYLPKILSFDEFKSVKSADGAMSFQMCNGENGKIIDIVENRQLEYLIKYFSYYTKKARSQVEYIIIDMYSPYVSLIKKMFPNAKIIIDLFHIIQLVSRSLNKTRIMLMKNDKKNYNKLKRYWKLLLKDNNKINNSLYKRYTCFPNLMREVDVLNYLLNTNEELKETYEIYQKLLTAFNTKDYNLFIKTLDEAPLNISEYMKTSIKSLNMYSQYIKNTLETTYSNGYIEGNNNFIKVIKRIAFGFRSFRRFKARILICKGLIKPIKKEAQFCAS